MGNVAVICFHCNVKKNDGTIEDFERIIAYIKRHSEGNKFQEGKVA